MEDPWKKLGDPVLAEAIKNSSEETREELARNVRHLL